MIMIASSILFFLYLFNLSASRVKSSILSRHRNISIFFSFCYNQGILQNDCLVYENFLFAVKQFFASIQLKIVYKKKAKTVKVFVLIVKKFLILIFCKISLKYTKILPAITFFLLLNDVIKQKNFFSTDPHDGKIVDLDPDWQMASTIYTLPIHIPGMISATMKTSEGTSMIYRNNPKK